MVELFLMASHGYPPGLGFFFHPDKGFSRVSKDLHHFVHYHSSNQDLVNSHSFNLRLHQKEEPKLRGGLLDYNPFLPIGSNSRRPLLVDLQELEDIGVISTCFILKTETHRDSLRFSYRIAEQCIRQEKILKLLSSGYIEAEGGLRDLSMLYDLMGPQKPITDLSQQSFATCSRWFFNETEPRKSLIYPTREFYFGKPFLDLVGNKISYMKNVNDVLSVISDLYLSKNTVKSSKQTMLVPYFERRRRVHSNTFSSKLATEKIAPPKSHEKTRRHQSQKKKTRTRTIKERNIYSNSYIHACETLLSIIVNRKQGKTAILTLKKSGSQLPQLLTQLSATIAGMGMAVVLSLVCKVACSRVPFCASKLLSAGLGLGLVWLSWAVNGLRDTVISIGKSFGKSGAKEEEMMFDLDENLKDVYFRAAVVMAVAVLQLGLN